LAGIATACTSSTAFGPCVGISDDRDPSLTYKVSAGNIFLAIVFSETIIVPVVVIADEVACPVGRKAVSP
jgi:hypothetical protein